MWADGKSMLVAAIIFFISLDLVAQDLSVFDSNSGLGNSNLQSARKLTEVYGEPAYCDRLPHSENPAVDFPGGFTLFYNGTLAEAQSYARVVFAGLCVSPGILIRRDYYIYHYVDETPTPTPTPTIEQEVSDSVNVINDTIGILDGMNHGRNLENDMLIFVGDITVPLLRDPPFLLSKENSDYLDDLSLLCAQNELDIDNTFGICELVEDLLRQIFEGDIDVHVENTESTTYFPEVCPEIYRIENAYDGNTDRIRFLAPAEDIDGRCVYIDLDIFDRVRAIEEGEPENHDYVTKNHICFYEEGNCNYTYINQIRLDHKAFQAPFLPPTVNPFTNFIGLCGFPAYQPFGAIVHEGNNECLGPLPKPNPIFFRVADPQDLPLPPFTLSQYCVTNTTVFPHIFHEGDVDRCLIADDLGILMYSHGTGEGDFAPLNEIGGSILFNGLEYLMRLFYCSRAGVICIH